MLDPCSGADSGFLKKGFICIKVGICFAYFI